MTYLILTVLLLGTACKDDRIRNRFAGAWEIESIQIIRYSGGQPASDTSYRNCGTWSFVDNGLDGVTGTYNRSLLVLYESVPCIFAGELGTGVDGKREGIITWGNDPVTDKRIRIEVGGTDLTFNVDKLNRRHFEFYFIRRNGNNAEIGEKQVFRLKRTKG